MLNQYHTLIWVDHRIAKVLHFNADANETTSVQSSHPHQHIHHKANSGDSGHAPVDKEFLERVAHAIPKTGPILITGPGSARNELRAYIERAHKDLAARISAVEPLDHPSDGELLAFGRRFFTADDRMHPQVSR